MIRRMKMLTAAGITAGVLVVTGCAAAAEPAELSDQFQVGDIMLEADLAEARQTVRELCHTGKGATDIRQAWDDYGYADRTGLEWIDAFTSVADFKYSTDSKAILNDGSATYPTVASLAENCLDAAWLISQPATDIRYPQMATASLAEFHDVHDSDEVLALERIAQLAEQAQ